MGTFVMGSFVLFLEPPLVSQNTGVSVLKSGISRVLRFVLLQALSRLLQRCRRVPGPDSGSA